MIIVSTDVVQQIMYMWCNRLCEVTCGNGCQDYMTVGMYAMGMYAMGMYAIGMYAMGMYAMGMYAMGMYAMGMYAMGMYAMGMGMYPWL